MSAVATGGKPGHQFAVQLTFPTIYENVYSSLGLPQKFYPQRTFAQPVVPMGDDFQAQWHNLQRIEANNRCMNGVRDNARSQIRANVSHAGYWGMPKPVLGQRKFANPAFGSGGIGGDIYSARHEDALRGGVLRTAEGQAFGRSRLQDRIAQLNAIEQAKAMFSTGTLMESSAMPIAVSEGMPDSAGPTSMIEFNVLRQAVMDTLSTGQLERLDITSVSRLLQLLFRIAPTANREELEDVIAGFDTLTDLLGGYEEQLNEGYLSAIQGHRRSKASFFYGVKQLIDKADEYTREMYARSLLSPKERLDLSKSLIKSLGFTKVLTRVKQTFNVRGEVKGQYLEASEEGVPFIPTLPTQIGFRRDAGAIDRFTQEAVPLNAIQAYGEPARFDVAPRNKWAKRGTAFFGEDSDSKDDGFDLRNPAQPTAQTTAGFAEGREQTSARNRSAMAEARDTATASMPVRPPSLAPPSSSPVRPPSLAPPRSSSGNPLAEEASRLVAERGDVSLSARAVAMGRENPTMKVKEIAEAIGAHVSTVRNALRKEGLMEGRGRMMKKKK